MTDVSGYSKEFIATALRRSAETINGQIEMEFAAINGRTFVLREEEADKFFAFEFIPNGRLAIPDDNGRVIYSDWKGHRFVENNPNGYLAAAKEDGIESDDIIRIGSGYNVYTRYLPSIDVAAEEFARSLRDNEYYDSFDRVLMEDPEFQAKLRASEEESRKAYRAEQNAAHAASMEDEVGLFKGLHGMMGPLADGAKQRILSFFNAPSHETWDNCARLMIKGASTTMWTLWTATDPDAVLALDPKGNWPRIPDADKLKQALRDLGEAKPYSDDTPTHRR